MVVLAVSVAEAVIFNSVGSTNKDLSVGERAISKAEGSGMRFQFQDLVQALRAAPTLH